MSFEIGNAPTPLNSARRINPTIVRAEIMHEQLLKKNIRSETLPPLPKSFADKILRQSKNSGAQPKSKKRAGRKTAGRATAKPGNRIHRFYRSDDCLAQKEDL